MKRNLEKTLAKIGIASSLLIGGCKLDFPDFLQFPKKEMTIEYAERAANKMREGYCKAENFKVGVCVGNRNYGYPLSSDSLYKNLVFTNDDEVTRNVLKPLNGFYRTDTFNDGEALVFKDGVIYSLYYKGLPNAGVVDHFSKNEIISPLIFLDKNVFLAGYDDLLIPNPDGPFKNLPPEEYYRNLLVKPQEENNLIIEYVDVYRNIGSQDHVWTKSNFELFDGLRDNSELFIQRKVYRRKRTKQLKLKNDYEAYQAFAPKLK